LGKAGMVIFTVLYVLSALAFFWIFYQMSGYMASWIHYVVAGLLAAGFILAAFRLKVNLRIKMSLKTPRLVTLIISFLVSLFWLYLLTAVFNEEPGGSAWVVGLTGIILIAGFMPFVFGWFNNGWYEHYRFSLATGALYAGLLFGLYILIPTKNILDIISQALFILIVTFLLIRAKRKYLRNNQEII